MANIKEQFEEWRRSESGKLSRKLLGTEWTKAKRTYIHFDKRRSSKTLSQYKDVFTNPKKLISHISFWPFLKIELREAQIKNPVKGKPRKKKIKKRNVYFAAHQDALVYSWYSFKLNKLYESLLTELDLGDCVIAYRKIPRKDKRSKNRCNIHFAQEVFDFIKSRKKGCTAVVADITGFFDSLDHEHLNDELKRVLGLKQGEDLPVDIKLIYDNLTSFKYVDADEVYKAFGIRYKTKKRQVGGKTKVFSVPVIDGKQINCILQPPLSRKDFQTLVVKTGLIKGNQNWNVKKKRHKGIMQGAPISSTLANIYMLSFDKAVNDFIQDRGGLYRRYSDDIVVVCDSSKYEEVMNFIMAEIAKYELDINPQKLDETLFEVGVDGGLVGVDPHAKTSKPKKMQYLGFVFDGINVYIRPKSLTRYYRKMKSKVRKAVNMAYGKRSKTRNKDNLVFRKLLYEKYIRKGCRSFISYALRAGEILGGGTIRRQLSKRTKIMEDYLKKKTSRAKRIKFAKLRRKKKSDS